MILFRIQLKKLRENAGYSQYSFAEAFGVAQSTIGNWESGKREPNFDTMQRLADFFGVTIDALLGRESVGGRPSPTQPGSMWIPVLGGVVAGVPIEAVEEILGWEEIDAKTAAQGEHFALRVKGDSMAPSLLDGDVVIVRQQPTADTGDIAVVIVNGDEATVKRIKKSPEGLMLIPSNSAYEPMFYSNDQTAQLPVEILGKVVESRRTY